MSKKSASTIAHTLMLVDSITKSIREVIPTYSDAHRAQINVYIYYTQM